MADDRAPESAARSETILPSWGAGRTARRRAAQPGPATSTLASARSSPAARLPDELASYPKDAGGPPGQPIFTDLDRAFLPNAGPTESPPSEPADLTSTYEAKLWALQQTLDQRDAQVRELVQQLDEAVAKTAAAEGARASAAAEVAILRDELGVLRGDLGLECAARALDDEEASRLRHAVEETENATRAMQTRVEHSEASLAVATKRLLDHDHAAQERAKMETAQRLTAASEEAAVLALREQAEASQQLAFEEQIVAIERTRAAALKQSARLSLQLEKAGQRVTQLESEVPQLRATAADLARDLEKSRDEYLQAVARIDELEARPTTAAAEPALVVAPHDDWEAPPGRASGAATATPNLSEPRANERPEIPQMPRDPDRVTPTHARKLQAVADTFRVPGPELIQLLADGGREVTAAEDRYLRGYCVRYEKTPPRRPRVKA